MAKSKKKGKSRGGKKSAKAKKGKHRGKRKMSAKQRAAALRNLKKARAAKKGKSRGGNKKAPTATTKSRGKKKGATSHKGKSRGGKKKGAPTKKVGKLHRYSGASACLKCHKMVFGGAKGMATHQKQRHGGTGAVGAQTEYLARKRAEMEEIKARKAYEKDMEKLFDEQAAKQAEKDAIAAAYRSSTRASSYPV